MREEEMRQENNVIALRSRRMRRPIDDQVEPAQATEGSEPAPITVLHAARGIINTGTVHGGQQITAVDLSGHHDEGADCDI